MVVYLFSMRERQPAGSPKLTCSKCKAELEESRKGKQRYCKKCHAAHMRTTRPKHSCLTEPQRKKANARSYVNEYLRRGKIKKEPCQVCGDNNSQMHHEDYSKPLEVIWLCRKHHLELHSIKKENAPCPKCKGSGREPKNQRISCLNYGGFGTSL